MARFRVLDALHGRSGRRTVDERGKGPRRILHSWNGWSRVLRWRGVSGRCRLATRLPIMLHLLEKAAVFIPKAINLTLRTFQLHAGAGQLALSFATDLDGRFEVFDIIRSYAR